MKDRITIVCYPWISSCSFYLNANVRIIYKSTKIHIILSLAKYANINKVQILWEAISKWRNMLLLRCSRKHEMFSNIKYNEIFMHYHLQINTLKSIMNSIFRLLISILRAGTLVLHSRCCNTGKKRMKAGVQSVARPIDTLHIIYVFMYIIKVAFLLWIGLGP